MAVGLCSCLQLNLQGRVGKIGPLLLPIAGMLHCMSADTPTYEAKETEHTLLQHIQVWAEGGADHLVLSSQPCLRRNYSSIYEYALENYDSYVWSSKFVANVLVPPDQATLNLIADHIVRTQGKDTMQVGPWAAACLHDCMPACFHACMDARGLRLGMIYQVCACYVC